MAARRACRHEAKTLSATMMTRLAGCLAFALVLARHRLAMAQETSTNQVATPATAWSVFEDTDPRECWAVSAPRDRQHARDGHRAVAVRRGDILKGLMIRSTGPPLQVQGQITFTGELPVRRWLDLSNMTGRR